MKVDMKKVNKTIGKIGKLLYNEKINPAETFIVLETSRIINDKLLNELKEDIGKDLKGYM